MSEQRHDDKIALAAEIQSSLADMWERAATGGRVKVLRGAAPVSDAPPPPSGTLCARLLDHANQEAGEDPSYRWIVTASDLLREAAAVIASADVPPQETRTKDEDDALTRVDTTGNAESSRTASTDLDGSVFPICRAPGCGCVATHGLNCQAHAPAFSADARLTDSEPGTATGSATDPYSSSADARAEETVTRIVAEMRASAKDRTQSACMRAALEGWADRLRAASPAPVAGSATEELIREAIQALIGRWRQEFTERRQKELVDDEGWLTGTGMLQDLTNDLEVTFMRAMQPPSASVVPPADPKNET